MEKKGISRGATAILTFVQHCLFAVLAVAVFVIAIGTNVRIQNLYGYQYHNLFDYDSGNQYQDTVLFNTLLGEDAKDVLRFGAIATQLETNGKYDAKKKIDVIAYNHRNDTMPEGAVEAVYYLEDLIKWSNLTPELFDYRYKTVDGKAIEDMVYSEHDRNYLIEQVLQAAKDLSKNYSEYIMYKDYYASGKSNLRYCIITDDTWNGEALYFTNVKEIMKGEQIPGEVFPELMTYIEYKPSMLEYKTNSSVKEQTFRNIEVKYDYAYPENTTIWIGVVDVMKNGSWDEFGQSALYYHNLYNLMYPCLYAAVICAILYLIILLFLSVKEGRARKSGKPILNSFDMMNTEVFLVISIAVFTGFMALIAGCVELFFSNYVNALFRWNEMLIAIGVCFFLLSILLLYLYYSFIRRCKTGVIWRNALLVRGMKRLVGAISKVFHNGPLALRVWGPFGALVLMHLLAIPVIVHVPFAIVGLLIVDGLVGFYLFEEAMKRREIVRGIHCISEGDFSYRVDVAHLHGENRDLGEAVNSIGNGIKVAVETSMKDERMKADLITNVSHDIKTPLTSIINYVDLLKRQDIQDETVRGYIQVLDEKSQRLKQLTDDLVEASKISSGNIVLQMDRINLVELIHQSVAEFDDKFDEKNLDVIITNKTQNPYVYADSRRIWRVIENLFNNIYKYAMGNTRVYVDLGNDERAQRVCLEIKNISAIALKCNPTELTERFIRGDESRTTEGSGLGLSIAKNLVEIQNGTFEVAIDGDLFKIVITFPVYVEEAKPRIVTAKAPEMAVPETKTVVETKMVVETPEEIVEESADANTSAQDIGNEEV